MVADFADRIEKATNGQIKIEQYGVGELTPVMEQFGAVVSNTIQIANHVGALSAGQVPVSAVEYGLPMSYRSVEDTWKIFYDEGFLDLLREAYADVGVYYLGFQTPYLGVINMSVKPIRSYSDFKGLKVRAVGSLATWYTKLEAGPVTMPMQEIYMALKLGTVDSATTGMDVHTDLKHYEVAKWIYKPYPTEATPLNMIVNLKVWNDLPDDLKQAIEKETMAWSRSNADWDLPVYNEVVDKFKTEGVQWTELPAGDVAKMQAAAVEVWDEWAEKDEYSARAVDIIKKFYNVK